MRLMSEEMQPMELQSDGGVCGKVGIDNEGSVESDSGRETSVGAGSVHQLNSVVEAGVSLVAPTETHCNVSTLAPNALVQKTLTPLVGSGTLASMDGSSIDAPLPIDVELGAAASGDAVRRAVACSNLTDSPLFLTLAPGGAGRAPTLDTSSDLNMFSDDEPDRQLSLNVSPHVFYATSLCFLGLLNIFDFVI